MAGKEKGYIVNVGGKKKMLFCNGRDDRALRVHHHYHVIKIQIILEMATVL